VRSILKIPPTYNLPHTVYYDPIVGMLVPMFDGDCASEDVKAICDIFDETNEKLMAYRDTKIGRADDLS
jgi:hypothetical protein